MLCRHESCGNRIVAFHKGETMKPAKSILYGATALMLAAGSAFGVPTADVPADDIAMAGSATDASTTMYEVDEDRDGRTDRLLILEQSDSLA
jgi:hypothetical protein